MTVADLVEAVQRRVETVQRDGRDARVAVARRTYDAAIDDVWDALTNPERIPRWFLPVSGDLRVGGRYQLQGNAGGEITECEPPRRLPLTWEFGGGASVVTLDLSEAGGGDTELVLRHAVGDDDHW